MDKTELKTLLAAAIKGDIADDEQTLTTFSRDASLFTRTPELVVYPKDADDVVAIVKTLAEAQKQDPSVHLAGRSAGTDMSGGPLTTGVVVSFMKYMNHLLEVGDSYAVTEPGVFYRDFEKETLEKNLILPSYPASRELCAMGGIVSNNSGGERTLEYGKTERYLESVNVVLSDGTQTTFGPLSPEQLEEKKKLSGLEGEIYRGVDEIVTQNAALIAAKKPKVMKNSAGYYLWDIRDPKTNTFNLAKLICGSQGTLALWTKAKINLVHPKPHRAMLVVFLYDLAPLPEIVRRVLKSGPESFESYDNHTFELAVKLLPKMLSEMGFLKAARLGVDFIPEAAMMATGGVPKLLLMAEFAEDTLEEADRKANEAREALADLHIHTKIEKNERESEKYWIVRRESFSLLRKNLKGLYPAPFIDDFVVPPACYPEFLPKINALLDQYKDHFIYTIAGHVGSGNFHIIPLMDLTKEENRQIILDLSPKVYELVIAEGGTTTGEHNDGIVRTPYLPMLFGNEMVALFEKVKKLFDPHDLFNPGKKVGGTFEDIKRDMIQVNTHG